MRQKWEMLIVGIFCLMLLIIPLPAQQAQDVLLQWNASTCPACEYNVWRAETQGGPYTKINSSPVSGTNYTDNTVAIGHTYYYVTSTFFPGGQGATLNVSATSGVVNKVTINSPGFGYTNLPGKCPSCGLVFQQRQNGPFTPGFTGGGEFPLDDGPGGGSGGSVFCTNADTNNIVFDGIQQCAVTNGGTGYSPAFTQAIPSDQFDTGVARPWNAASCPARFDASTCANPLNVGGYSPEAQATIGTATLTNPHAPVTSGVWK